MYYIAFTDVRKGIVSVLANEMDISLLSSSKRHRELVAVFKGYDVDLTKAYMFKGKIRKF